MTRAEKLAIAGIASRVLHVLVLLAIHWPF